MKLPLLLAIVVGCAPRSTPRDGPHANEAAPTRTLAAAGDGGAAGTSLGADSGASIACNHTPPNFRLGEITAAAVPPQLTVDAPILLAWKESGGDRPKLESALLWIRLKDGERPYYRLASVYRQPPGDSRWHLAEVSNVNYSPLQNYTHPPTAAEFDAFLKKAIWFWGPDDGTTLRDSEVCEAGWMEAFGAKPWHQFNPKCGCNPNDPVCSCP